MASTITRRESGANPSKSAPPPTASRQIPNRCTEENTKHPCERGLELKSAIAELEAEYDELKDAITSWCEVHGEHGSLLGSYSLRYTPRYSYPQEVELMRLNLKAAEEAARASGTAKVINTTVSAAAHVNKTSAKVRAIR